LVIEAILNNLFEQDATALYLYFTVTCASTRCNQVCCNAQFVILLYIVGVWRNVDIQQTTCQANWNISASGRNPIVV